MSLRSIGRLCGTQNRRSKSHGELVETHQKENPIVIQNSGWANIPPELLGDVMKRLEKSESKWPARKNVVACAAVCRSWRKMCKDTVKSPEFSAKLTFPVSVKQPGPREGIIQCFIKRDKSNMTFHLFVSPSPAPLFDNGKFILSAKRTRRIPDIEYVISMDSNNISSLSSTFIGKMRSNFLGSKYIIYDSASAHNIAEVSYESNVLGNRGPRRMHCIMHSIPALALEPDGTIPGHPNILQSSLVGPQGGKDENQEKEGPLVLRNKPPRWHQKLQCWCLNFRGRVTIASVKNFQLMSAAAVQPPRAVSSQQQAEQSDHEKIILQFGRVGKDMFTMDYRYPLSAFQAFAICLSSFGTKLTCE